MDGELAPEEKLAEIPVAERLGVSRTPVRLAFRTLEQEGLLRKRGKRGYMVREFTVSDVQCALSEEFEKLRFAHLQHQIVLDALLMGEGARAEMLMREHAYVGMRYAEFFGIAKYDVMSSSK